MSPADLRKEGSAYDLTLATGILAASVQIQPYSRRNKTYYFRNISITLT